MASSDCVMYRNKNISYCTLMPASPSAARKALRGDSPGTRNLYIIFLFFLLLTSYGMRGQIITTVAGNGICGHMGDGGAATAAHIGNVVGITVDSKGNLYFTETSHSVGLTDSSWVRKVDTAGIITTVAGTGYWVYSGDGGAATAAGLDAAAVAVDQNDNLYISGDGRIRKVDAAGIITTIAGTGSTIGPAGNGGPATAARLSGYGMCFDKHGSLYTGTLNFGPPTSQVRKIDTMGIITAFAGNNTAGYSGDGGPATAAQFNNPAWVAADVFGNIFIADISNHKIRKVDPSGIIRSVAGWHNPITGTVYSGYGGDCGPATAAYLYNPQSMAVDSFRNIFFSDASNNRIRVVDASGFIRTIAGTGTAGYGGDGGSATAAILDGPGNVAMDNKGNIYFVDHNNYRIRKFKPVFAAPYFSGGTSQSITACAGGIDSINSVLAVVDTLAGQTDDWSVVLPAAHGTVTASYSATSTGATLTPTGLYYLPGPGFTGYDTFKVAVRNCMGADTIAIYVHVVSPSAVALSGPAGVCAGATGNITATTTGGTWSSSNTAVATIGSASGTVTSIAAGAATITYTLSLSCGTALFTKAFTVNPLPSTPGFTGPSSICAGNTTSLTSAPSGGVWSSGSTGTATVNSASGTVTGVAAGVAQITYTLSTGCASSVSVTVIPVPAPITGIAATCMGMTTTLGSTTAGGVWSSSSPGIATVASATGVVSGIATGTSFISYTLPTGCGVTKSVTINTSPTAVSGLSSICAGANTTLYNGTPGGTWLSRNPAIATVDGAGVVTGVAGGSVYIVYSMGAGCADSMAMNIDPAPAAISGSAALCLSAASPFTDATTGGYWTSSASSVADVDAGTGVVTGMGLGTATISYTLLSTGCFVTRAVTVNSAPTAISGAGAVCVSGNITLSNGVSGGVWTSSNTGTAIVNSASGTVTGVSAGTATITYSMGVGCYVTKSITVNPLPAAISGAGAVCGSGGSTTLISGPGGGTWVSSNTAVASIGSGSGMVVGGPVGSATVVTITYTLPTTCRVTAPFTVNPVPATITGATNVCSGSAVALATTTAGGVWSSSSAGTATVNSASGMVTGVVAGTATISYTLATGCSATKNITVNAAPTNIIGALNVCVGSSITLTNGTAGGTWSRSNSNVTVNSSSGTVTGVAVGASVITYTLPTGCYTTKTITVGASGGTITGVSQLCVGGTATLTASGAGTWSSSSTGTATVNSATGVVTGVAAGITNITFAVSGGCPATRTITVNALPAVFGVSGGGAYCAGGTGLHVGLGGSATGVDYQLFNGGTAGVVVPGTGGALDYGLVTAPGTYTVTATNTITGCTNAMAGSATISINPPPPAISGATTICMGSSTTLTNTGGGTWSSSSTAVATIGSASGVVNGLAIGSAVITYTLPSTCYTTTTMNVSSAPTAITGASAVCAGDNTILASAPSGGLWSSSATGTATVNSASGMVTGVAAGAVTITYSLGTSCHVTKVMTVLASPGAITGIMSLCVGGMSALSAGSGGVWTSSNTGVAGVGSGSGMVTGMAPGTTVISYTAGGCSTTATLTVNPVPSTIGGPAAVCVGASATETNTVAGGIWSTISANITIIGSTGVVSGVLAGTASITYALGSCNVTRIITINAAPTISGTAGICVSGSTTLTASGTGTWTSGATGVATVGSISGTVTGSSAGTAPITFTPSTGCIAVKVVTVNTTPSTITGTKRVCVNATTILGNTALGGTWTSGSTGTAIVNSSSGTVTGVAAGTATIIYSLGTGCTVTTSVTVDPLPLPITGTTSMCVGNMSALSSATTGGVWTSGSTGIATVGSSSGIVTGVAVGSTGITYTNPLTGCAVTATVNITSMPAAISGANNVCAGSSTTLTNSTAGGVWSSSNPIIADIGSASGVVSGFVAGGVTITYSLGVGCEVTKAVTVNPLPASITGATNICLGSTTTLSDATPGGTWSSATGNATVNSSSGTVTGVAGGSAVISYTISTGCAATYAVSVVVVPAISNVHSICAWGDTLWVHNANPLGSYSSTLVTVTNLGGGDGIVTAFSPGTGTITYTLAGLGCITTSSITVNPLPNIISGTMNICTGTTTTLSNTTPAGAWSSSNLAVATIGSASGLMAGVAGGTSTIAYTLQTGCKVDTLITVSTFPVAGTITGADMVCTGETSALSAGAGGGVWSSGAPAVASVTLGGVVSGITAGTSTISYTVTNVCGTAQATKTVTVNQTPSAGVITGIDSVCVGSIVALSDTATGGVWSVRNGNAGVTSTGMVSGLAGGMDTVYYTVTNAGCTARAMLPVRVIPLSECSALGVQWYNADDIRVYPNPSNGEFVISGVLATDGDVRAEMTNVLGQVVYSGSIASKNGILSEHIHVANLAGGVYLLTLYTPVGSSVFHLIIE